MKRLYEIGALVVLLVLISILNGCATYVVKDGAGNIVEQGSSGGFGRDIVHTKVTVTMTTIVNGTPVTQTTSTDSISSTSNVANVMGAMNQILGTIVDASAKLKPL